MGIKGKLGRWIHEFLKDRRQSVRVQGINSDESDVISSVPQGTVLAPLLFIIVLSDIDKDITGSKIISFADDTKISKDINNEDDLAILQSDVNKVCKWAIDNNMTFNTEKFQLLRYGKKENLKKTQYVLNHGHNIQEQEQAKDLGIVMNKNANFSAQIEISTNKAKRTMGLIFRTFQRRDKELMLPLLKTLIIPILEYCSVLTAPYKQEEISRIEGIQRHFTSKIEGLNHATYHERLQILNLYSLERRRERYMIIYAWKILEGHVANLPKNPLAIKQTLESRRGRICQVPNLVTKQCQTL